MGPEPKSSDFSTGCATPLPGHTFVANTVAHTDARSAFDWCLFGLVAVSPVIGLHPVINPNHGFGLRVSPNSGGNTVVLHQVFSPPHMQFQWS